MSKNTVRAARVRETPAAPWNFLADLGRQQMAVAADASCAMFRGFEEMRKIQEKAAHDATTRHEALASKLHGNCQPVDVISAQATMLRDDFESATQCWQQLAATALEMQTEMIGCASHLLDADSAMESVSAVEAFDMIPGIASFFPPRASPAAANAGKR